MTVTSEVREIRDRISRDKARLYALGDQLSDEKPLAALDLRRAAGHLGAAFNNLGDALLMPLEPIINQEGGAEAPLVLEHQS